MIDMKILGGLEENSSQRRKVYDKGKNCPTLQAAMGDGGGNIPLIIVRGNYDKNKTSNQTRLDRA